MKRLIFLAVMLVITLAFIQTVWAQVLKPEGSTTEVITTVRATNWPDSLVKNQVNVTAILPLPTSNTICVAASPGVWISVNGGSWISRGSKEGLTPSSGYITSFAVNSLGYIFAGALNGLFRSTNNGSSWAKIQNFTVFDLLVTPDGTIFAADTGIFRSTDNGASWIQVAGSNVTDPYVQQLGYSSGTIFAGISSGMPTAGNGILRSFDNGNSWSFANTGLTDHKNVYGIASQPNSQNMFIVTEDNGAFQSTNGGNSWSRFSAIPEVYGTSAASFSSMGAVFMGFNTIGTNRSGLYRYRGLGYLDTIPGYSWMAVLSIAQLSSNQILVGTHNGLYITTFNIVATPVEETPNTTPVTFSLSQNYPNPFNPTTTIQFLLTERASVKLTITNTRGQEVVRLLDGQEMSIGEHRITWNAEKYASGVYWYRLETSTGLISARKMVLVK